LKAATLSDRLARRGFNVMPILHPAVPERLARLRFFVTADHTADQIDAAAEATSQELGDIAGTAETLLALAQKLA
jgi:8-amino-7-oxononanoate synthase